LETNEIRRRQIRTAMFISSWGLQEQTPQHWKNCPGFDLLQRQMFLAIYFYDIQR
jgi:hypothetical protein